MTKRQLAFLNAVLAIILGILGGLVAFFLTGWLYLAAGEIVQWELPFPSLITAEITYLAYVVAIAVSVYRFLKKHSATASPHR